MGLREPKAATLPAGKLPAIRTFTMPTEMNAVGGIFGGWIMAQVDIAGSIPAARRAKGRVATVAVNSFEFHEPVFLGDLVSFYADIIKTGRTSITVFVEVFAERNPQQLQCVKVTEATLTYVAIDEDHQPRALPSATSI